jgi:hypothetical protein
MKVIRRSSEVAFDAGAVYFLRGFGEKRGCQIGFKQQISRAPQSSGSE